MRRHNSIRLGGQVAENIYGELKRSLSISGGLTFDESSYLSGEEIRITQEDVDETGINDGYFQASVNGWSDLAISGRNNESKTSVIVTYRNTPKAKRRAREFAERWGR